jgi:hypothetical protein
MLETLRVQSDSSRFARRADRDNDMATKGYRYAGRKDPELMSEDEWDEELAEMNVRMDELALEMQQNARSRWVYEWPMRKPKEKWPVKELMARRQHRLLRRWLRHAENLNRPEEGFRYVSQRLGEISVMLRMKWDQMKISSTARRAERKFPISRWAKS